ncbi:roadblock/LC7 domain-containing protein [Amycolatopsis sp. H20-H5]|uniref:roadblock/LC7 domain-containing protein n=1 Tax=Amycolatopsis sp. H20-H5 TaxID=3046309 RepID=UPI002DC02E4A|nr:roadblock/LC7 domain-containing protein [Amycolatopsis sp. H20-H5]MEC3981592.1 roadblock/LC7 domain-containing protein [Amycolatopsis sp. H20-H5]
MTATAGRRSHAAESFNWLLNRFVSETPGVDQAIAVSADGLLIAMSAKLDSANADRLAAITSAIMSLANGATRCYDLGGPSKVIIDLERGFMLFSVISSGSALGVLARKSADLGNVAFEMAQFTNRAGTALTPGLIEELKNTVGT